MGKFASLLQEMKAIKKYAEKTQFATYLLKTFQQDKRLKLTLEDRAEISGVIFTELAELAEVIPTLPSYKKKDEALEYGDRLFCIVMQLFASPAEIPPAQLDELKNFGLVMEKERFVEREIEHVFEKGNMSKYDVEHLIEAVSAIKDEYQRGTLYSGMLHFKDALDKLPEDSKSLLSEYTVAEIKRYITAEADEEMIDSLEVACDVCAYFLTDELVALLYEVLKLGRANLSYYVTDTLLKAGKRVPDETVRLLAADLEYASMSYVLLENHGQADRFPPECATEEYLAKSSMIRWLVYPTELGELPEEIEYLGKVKKSEVYHIFRFKSHSENLGNDIKGRWLIGWSSEEGGTFSNFDLYAEYEQKTLDKTLKYIKRKLL